MTRSVRNGAIPIPRGEAAAPIPPVRPRHRRRRHPPCQQTCSNDTIYACYPECAAHPGATEVFAVPGVGYVAGGNNSNTGLALGMCQASCLGIENSSTTSVPCRSRTRAGEVRTEGLVEWALRAKSRPVRRVDLPPGTAGDILYGEAPFGWRLTADQSSSFGIPRSSACSRSQGTSISVERLPIRRTVVERSRTMGVVNRRGSPWVERCWEVIHRRQDVPTEAHLPAVRGNREQRSGAVDASRSAQAFKAHACAVSPGASPQSSRTPARRPCARRGTRVTRSRRR